MKNFELNAFTTALTTADRNAVRVPAVKVIIACVMVSQNMEKGLTEGDALTMYGVPATKRKEHARYNQGKGYWKDFLKPISDNRQYLVKFFDQLKALDLKGSFAQIADTIITADIYGENSAPQNKKEWFEFLQAFLPVDRDWKGKKDAPKKADEKAAKDADGKKPAVGKDKEGGAAKRAADDNVTSAVEALVSKLEDHTQALVTHQLEALDAAGLPKAHRAKVSKAMMALVLDMQKDLKAQLTK